MVGKRIVGKRDYTYHHHHHHEIRDHHHHDGSECARQADVGPASNEQGLEPQNQLQQEGCKGGCDEDDNHHNYDEDYHHANDDDHQYANDDDHNANDDHHPRSAGRLQSEGKGVVIKYLYCIYFCL